jgi:hypothetical protein
MTAGRRCRKAAACAFAGWCRGRFRPFVWRLARDLDLAGEVSNDGEGVLIVASGGAGPGDWWRRRLHGSRRSMRPNCRNRLRPDRSALSQAGRALRRPSFRPMRQRARPALPKCANRAGGAMVMPLPIAPIAGRA